MNYLKGECSYRCAAVEEEIQRLSSACLLILNNPPAMCGPVTARLPSNLTQQNLSHEAVSGALV